MMGKRTYYKKIESDEEMLFSTEIARKYKIYRINNGTDKVNNSLNGKLIEVIINEYIEENKLKIEELYYPTFSGISRVYPESVYKPALEIFLERQCIDSNKKYYKDKNGIIYKIS